jgi:hypothetical protein
MILVIASELDDVAEAAVATWPNGGAHLMRPRDLCSQGWRIEVGRTQQGTLVADGEPIAVECVNGVLNRLALVDERELVSIELSERRYVAAELTAFMFYVLSQLRCPMINRPTVSNLAGCDWRMDEWVYRGREKGIPFAPHSARCPSSLRSGPDLRRTVILAEAVALSNDDRYAQHMIELVCRAGLMYADLCYSIHDGRCALHSVSLIPDLSNPEIATSIHQFFQGALA